MLSIRPSNIIEIENCSNAYSYFVDFFKLIRFTFGIFICAITLVNEGYSHIMVNIIENTPLT